MTLSRRLFVRTLGLGGAATLAAPAIVARGHEALLGAGKAPEATIGKQTVPLSTMLLAVPGAPIRIDSNENPNGPGEAALQGIRAAFGEAGRYPDQPGEDLTAAVARRHRLAPENIVMGCGSTEILRMAVQEFTRDRLPLITAAPTFEDAAWFARRTGSPVTAVPVDAALRLDLAAMARKASGAGLVYLCNPNNPTGTARGASAVKDFVSQVARSSPGATILIDEAYFEYVDDPAYATAIPLAMENPRVVVARTFSKVFGMAGLRVGYAVAAADTIKALSQWKLPSGVNQLGAAAALAALGDEDHIEQQRRLNRETRTFTRRFFESAGYKVVPSETNFMMIDIRRDVKEFRAACRARNVMIGRAFPPLDGYARVSMGTMDEMRQAVEIFRQVLAAG